jgi:tetratricopeptide (TPR) repeat protein
MKRKISVFIASPGDLSNERKHFRVAIDQLNHGFGDGAKVIFEPLGWEDTLASTGRRNQRVINEEIDKSDVFILAMHRRWGQEAPDARPYSSYTEEEFHRALERWKKEEKPEIFVFFKRVDPESEADPGPQLTKVMDFRKQLEETRQVLYHYFEDEKSFVSEVDRHLRAYVNDELPKSDRQRDLIVLPLAALEEVEKAKAIAIKKIEEAKEARDAERESRLKIESMQFQIAKDAADFSREGKIEYARQKFAELVVETINLRVLYLGYEFYYQTGDLDSAIFVLEKWLNLNGSDEKSAETASAYSNLGSLYKAQGEFERAEEMIQRSLSINEALGRKEGMANQYSNLGNLYKTRGKLESAEEMFQKALAINSTLGRKEGMADAYSNLGILYMTRGGIEYKKIFLNSIDIEKELGPKKGMADVCSNLGIPYMTRGELERAEEMFRKALDINEKHGRKEGISEANNNLNILCKIRGELERANEMFQKALDINEALGRKEGMADAYGNLGILYKTRGEHERAKEMFQKSLFLFGELKLPVVNEISKLLNDLHSNFSK